MNLELMVLDQIKQKQENCLIGLNLKDFLYYSTLLDLKHKENVGTLRLYENQSLYVLVSQNSPLTYTIVRYWDKTKKYMDGE